MAWFVKLKWKHWQCCKYLLGVLLVLPYCYGTIDATEKTDESAANGEYMAGPSNVFANEGDMHFDVPMIDIIDTYSHSDREQLHNIDENDGEGIGTIDINSQSDDKEKSDKLPSEIESTKESNVATSMEGMELVQKSEEDITLISDAQILHQETNVDIDTTSSVLESNGDATVDIEEQPDDQSRDENRLKGGIYGSILKSFVGEYFNSIDSIIGPVLQELHSSAEEKPDTSSLEEPKLASEAGGNADLNPESTVVSNETDSKNTTDSKSKKLKFKCVGKNITENDTGAVRHVNNTELLNLLAFDKNESYTDCVMVMFYAPWCRFCAETAPHYNALGRAFPQLEVLAIDAVHFSNLNARFGTVAVPNIMLFHQSRSVVRFNQSERVFDKMVVFVSNVTGLGASPSVNLSEEDYIGPVCSVPTSERDYLLWFAWVFVLSCSSYMFVQSTFGQRIINKVKLLWQEHQHIE